MPTKVTVHAGQGHTRVNHSRSMFVHCKMHQLPKCSYGTHGSQLGYNFKNIINILSIS